LPYEIEASFRRNLPQRHCIPSALLRTCRQVYNEAHEYLYKFNTFHVGDNPDDANYAISWLHKIDKKNAKLIRRVTIDIYKCKTESRTLPFVVFMFELRNVATKLEELSLWLGRKVQQRYLTSHRFLVRELERFGELKKITIGGNYATWWPDYLRTKFSMAKVLDHDINVEVVYVDSETPAWHHREEERTIWALKVSKEANAIQQAKFDEKYEDWLRSNARFFESWAQDGKAQWRGYCQCDDCIRSREASGNWSAENETYMEDSISYYEPQELTAPGGVVRAGIGGAYLAQNIAIGDSTRPADGMTVAETVSERLEIQEEPEEQSSYDIYIKGIEAPNTFMPGIPEPDEPSDEPSSLPQYPVPLNRRKLRREPRRWYGASFHE
jgi:hypothetical protein